MSRNINLGMRRRALSLSREVPLVDDDVMDVDDEDDDVIGEGNQLMQWIER